MIALIGSVMVAVGVVVFGDLVLRVVGRFLCVVELLTAVGAVRLSGGQEATLLALSYVVWHLGHLWHAVRSGFWLSPVAELADRVFVMLVRPPFVWWWLEQVRASGERDGPLGPRLSRRTSGE